MLKEDPNHRLRERWRHEVQREQSSPDRDSSLMAFLLEEARTDLSHGGAGVAALLASAEQIMGVAFNTIQETGDLTNHAEMVLLHGVSRELQKMSEEERRSLSIYVTLEPCLMCCAALSFAGIKRIVYSALSEDANPEQMIVRHLTLPRANPHFVRGPFILVPGIRRAEGQALLREMNKAAGDPPELRT